MALTRGVFVVCYSDPRQRLRRRCYDEIATGTF